MTNKYIMTKSEYNKKHSHLNAAQLLSAYHLHLTEEWENDGFTLVNGNRLLYLREDGCALKTPQGSLNQSQACQPTT